MAEKVMSRKKMEKKYGRLKQKAVNIIRLRSLQM